MYVQYLSLQVCLLAKQESGFGSVAVRCAAIAMRCDAMRCEAVCACEGERFLWLVFPVGCGRAVPCPTPFVSTTLLSNEKAMKSNTK